MNDYSPLFWNDSAIFTTTNLSYVPDSDFVSSSANLVLKPLKYFVRPFEQFLFMIFFFFPARHWFLSVMCISKPVEFWFNVISIQSNQSSAKY